MLESGLLFEDSGILGLGPGAERLYGAKHFMALASVFDTPLLCQVICGADNLGSVHPLSFAKFGQQPIIISLGGRAWEVTQLDRKRSIAHVVPIDGLGKSRWLGQSLPLSYRVCRAARDILAGEEIDPMWSRRAVSEITTARSEIIVARAQATVVSSEPGGGQTKWWTFGGLKANAALAEMIAREGVSVSSFDNYFVEFQGSSSAHTVKTLLEAIIPSQAEELPTATTPSIKVKFWECLSTNHQKDFIKARYVDISQASAILSEPRFHSGSR